MGVFHPGAVGQGQQRGHRQHQPVAGYAGWVGSPGLVPLPAQALEGLEAQLDPEPQGVPTRPHFWGGRSVRMTQGSSCSAYQTTSRVQRRWAVGGPKAVPRPIQAVSGRETKRRAGNRRPPSAQKVMSSDSAYRGASPGRISASTAWDWICPGRRGQSRSFPGERLGPVP